MRILFMGTPDFAKESLEAIYNAGHNILGVVTNPDKPKGRGKTLLPTPVKEEAMKHEIPVYQPLKVRDSEFVETLKELADVKAEVEKLLDVFKFRDAQKEAMNLARIGNKYLADTEPWKLVKTDMDRVATILNIALQLVANLAIAFEPFLPFSSEKLRQMLNMETFEWDQLGRTDLLAEGHQLNKAELLFEKIEDETIQAQVDKLLATKKANEAASYKANPIKPIIAFEEFEKLDIRVGTVLECEVVPKMKKLLKFKIADGLENRTIVSGIAQHYKPEELIGKQVLFIANLAPRQFKNGLVSEGMILSAENFDGTLAVTSLLREVKPGSEVK